VSRTAYFPSFRFTYDLDEYTCRLHNRYRDLFCATTTFRQPYTFVWKLLESTLNVDRPLFSSLRRAVLDFGSKVESPRLLPFETTAAFFNEHDVLQELDTTYQLISYILRTNLPLLARMALNLVEKGGLL
jgi:hypothetical protein